MPHNVKLLDRFEIAEGTMAFVWEKPEGYQFKAGQAGDWKLIDPPETDAEGDLRSFSLACAPADPHLRTATRMRDTAFKRTLKSMPLGTLIQLEDAWGEFILESGRPAVLLAGGIGVTPFVSMLRDAVVTKSTQQITLFYSNRRPEDTAFHDEINDCAKLNSAITIVETMTEMTKSSETWSGEQGFIDEKMLQRHLKDLNEPIYYIAGPPQMVAAMKKMLLDAKIDAKSIRVDEFEGY